MFCRLGISAKVRYEADMFRNIRLYEIAPQAADVRKAVDCDVDGKVVVGMYATQMGTQI